jgi:aminoglycoside phosphotransferase (APT) family kinase protein
VSEEQALPGGKLAGGVVRVGKTVHRPTGPWTPAVHALLRHLEAVGFAGAPRVFGYDEDGREVVEFMEGAVPWQGAHHDLLGTDAAVRRVGRLLRSFHDAVSTFRPDGDAVWRFPEMQADALPFLDDRGLIVCHNDPAAWNLVIGPSRWAFVDWDAAGPRPPIWDLAYCAASIVPISPTPAQAGWREPVPVASRLRTLAGGYGLGSKDLARLPEIVVARIRSSYRHMQRRAEAGIAPWDELWINGHGQTWAAMLRFAETNAARWSAELANS